MTLLNAASSGTFVVALKVQRVQFNSRQKRIQTDRPLNPPVLSVPQW